MGRLVVVVRSAVASVVTARLVVERVGRAGTARRGRALMAGLWAAKERLAVRLVGVVAAPSGDEASLEGRNRARMEGARAVKGSSAAEW